MGPVQKNQSTSTGPAVGCRRGSCRQAGATGAAATHWWLQVVQEAQAHRCEGATDSGERQGQQAGDAPEGASLMAHGNGALQML